MNILCLISNKNVCKKYLYIINRNKFFIALKISKSKFIKKECSNVFKCTYK